MIKIFNEEIIKDSKGDCDIIDITQDIRDAVHKSHFKSGTAAIFSVGSTASITTIEYEPGLIQDLPKLMDKLIPKHAKYFHNETWGDGNGHSHLRSAIFGTSYTVPVIKSDLVLGTWQQIVLIDFDNRPRTRRIIVQITGA